MWTFGLPMHENPFFLVGRTSLGVGHDGGGRARPSSRGERHYDVSAIFIIFAGNLRLSRTHAPAATDPKLPNCGSSAVAGGISSCCRPAAREFWGPWRRAQRGGWEIKQDGTPGKEAGRQLLESCDGADDELVHRTDYCVRALKGSTAMKAAAEYWLYLRSATVSALLVPRHGRDPSRKAMERTSQAETSCVNHKICSEARRS